MLPATRLQSSSMPNSLRASLAVLPAYLAQLAALICLVLWPLLAFGWLGQPYLGALVGPTLLLSDTRAAQPFGDQRLVPPASAAAKTVSLAGRSFPAGTQLVALDRQRIDSLPQLHSLLRARQIGDQARLVLRTPQGELSSLDIQLKRFPPAVWLAGFGLPYLVSLVYLFAGLYVFRRRRPGASQPAGRGFALFSSCAALAIGGLFDLHTTARLVGVWTFALPLAAGALIQFALLFPEEPACARRWPALRDVGFLPATALPLLALPAVYGQARPLDFLFFWRLEYLFSGLAVLFTLVLMLLRQSRKISPSAGAGAGRLLWGGLLAFVPLGAGIVLSAANPQTPPPSWLLLSLALFPLAGVSGFLALAESAPTGFRASGFLATVLRLLSRLLSRRFLSRSLLYLLLSALAAASYASLVAGLSLLLGESLQPTNPFLVGLMVFLLAVLLDPLRSRLQGLVEASFLRSRSLFQQRLQDFSLELTHGCEAASALGSQAILSLLRASATRDLQPAQLHVFFQDPLNGLYRAAPGEDGKPTSDLRFPAASPLVQALASRRQALSLPPGEALPDGLQGDSPRLALLGAQLFVPLPGRQALAGWLALGPRLTGEAYTSQAMEYLESLCDQAAAALERAQVVADLERRISEMDVLTRIAQGINFTLQFDDILELIYAQTNRVIPCRDFCVTLVDRLTGRLRPVFFLQDDQRLSERESWPLEDGYGLESLVVSSQRALATDDYARECRARAHVPILQGVYAWIGLPLNSGADTIGVISLASRDPALVFTGEQGSLLQAIADQVAGAIVKANLLQESEDRARQLATLNEIGRGLTSTLELQPLLERFLTSATEILACEAGSLFLIDENTGELVFEVVNGPVAADLLGKRLPPGTGVAGEAVLTRTAIIANDAQRRKDWFHKTDEQTGFKTQDLLAVPMLLKEQVVGVLEVINKSDGSHFTESDRDLLITFASQATIAIENARLYTLTDQALAARVEELSVMQHIDRDLNASLDVDRALGITLDWSLRQSGADAGLVGIVEGLRVRVMAWQGYDSSLHFDQEPGSQEPPYLPGEMQALGRAIRTGLPECLTAADFAALQPGDELPAESVLLPGARSQVVLPMRREPDVIGILLLESRSPQPPSPEVMAFLSRLVDHAAIAIANAQLYAEVQAANLAKSKFVSFVAHELKNPMASIKGYTELVANGMAGPVSEMQASFLATVRSNVDRMNTIVSDLNDLTKIQVGSLRLEFKPVQVHEIAEEAVRSLRRQIEEKEQRLSIHLPDDLPLVWADGTRLGQVMTNLISNASKYTPDQGEILVAAERASVEEGAGSGLQAVHIWVQDSGIGIPPEDHERVFQQYFRSEKSKEVASGTGLGLNICRSLVEMQGGRIWFESQPGAGATFHFTVPVAESA